MIQMLIIGHIGNDATSIITPGGATVTNFSVAHTDKFTKDGVTKEKTTWVKCALWGENKVAQYLRKGTQVLCQGVPESGAYMKDSEAVAELKMTVFNLELLGAKKESSIVQS